MEEIAHIGKGIQINIDINQDILWTHRSNFVFRKLWVTDDGKPILPPDDVAISKSFLHSTYFGH